MEDLSFAIKAIDLSGGVLRQFGGSLDALSAKTRDFARQHAAGMEQARTSSGNFIKSLDLMGNAMGFLRGAAGLLGGSLNLVSGVFGGIVSVGKSVIGVFGQIIGGALHLAEVIGGALWSAAQRTFGFLAQVAAGGLAALAAALFGVAKTGLSMNDTILGGTTALTKLLGSSQAATGFMAALQDEAAKSIPTLKDLIPIATQLVQAYGPANLGRVLPTIRAFGDAAAIAAGGDTNRMNMALLGFRQLINKGMPQQEELNQIGENLGVNLNAILKRAFGTANTEVLQKGGVTGMKVADAIVAGLQRQFGGAQAGAALTRGGIWSNIQDAFNALSEKVTRGFGERVRLSLKVGLDTLNEVMGRRDLMDAFARGFDRIGDAILYVARQAPRAVEWLARLLNSDQFRRWVTGAESAFRNVVAGAKVAYLWLGTHWDDLWAGARETLRLTWAYVGEAFDGIQAHGADIADALLAGWNNLWTSAQNVLRFSVAVLKGIFTGFQRSVGGSLNSIKIDWNAVWEEIKNATVATVKVVGGTIAGLTAVFINLFKVQQSGRTGIQDLAESFKGFAVVAAATVGSVIVKAFALGTAFLTVSALIRASFGDVAGALLDFARAGVLAAGGVAAASGTIGLIKGIKGLDTSGITKGFKDYDKQPGPLGDFARGYNAFGAGFDATYGPASITSPGMPALPSNAKPATSGNPNLPPGGALALPVPASRPGVTVIPPVAIPAFPYSPGYGPQGAVSPSAAAGGNGVAPGAVPAAARQGGGGGNTYVFAPTILPNKQQLWDMFNAWYTEMERRSGNYSPSR